MFTIIDILQMHWGSEFHNLITRAGYTPHFYTICQPLLTDIAMYNNAVNNTITDYSFAAVVAILPSSHGIEKIII